MTLSVPDGPVENDWSRPKTLVWIDAREAAIVRWRHDRARLERFESDVPARRRMTGHLRHDPAVRHGGGGSSQHAGEPRRLERLQRFIGSVADRLGAEDDLLILGPGPVRLRLERQIRDEDHRHGRQRTVTCAAEGRRSERQLVARLRAFADAEAPRVTRA